jgi:trehalose 6-phosphate phosphatase
MKDTTLQNAFDLLDRLKAARDDSQQLLVGLDFDGTLAAIVPQPADATLLGGAADALARLNARNDTEVAVITGRAIADIRSRVGMPHLHYAGNHGLEIESPGKRWIHPDAEPHRTTMPDVVTALRAALTEWPEITIENKLVSLSVHFRTVTNEEDSSRIVAAVHDAVQPFSEHLRLTGGHMVVEIRPGIEWDKGSAFASLRTSLGFDNAPALFIGDDRTDEDAFREMTGACDVGIIVGTSRRYETRATAVLDSPAAVVRFLDALAD